LAGLDIADHLAVYAHAVDQQQAALNGGTRADERFKALHAVVPGQRLEFFEHPANSLIAIAWGLLAQRCCRPEFSIQNNLRVFLNKLKLKNQLNFLNLFYE
jgi:hypothetical protein